MPLQSERSTQNSYIVEAKILEMFKNISGEIDIKETVQKLYTHVFEEIYWFESKSFQTSRDMFLFL